jgi:hypothetical protein
MLRLNHELLSVSGIASSYARDVLNKTPPLLGTPSLLSRYQQRLKKIYFPNVTEISLPLFELDQLFFSYPNLKLALQEIFLSKKTPDEIMQVLEKLSEDEFYAIEFYQNQWKKMTNSLGYFDDREDLLPLFRELVLSCRAMSALIEKNLADEEMPFIYAYRLMVLFVNREGPIPSADDISKWTEDLLRQCPSLKGGKPYHDVILNVIQLPYRHHVRDLDSWLKLIKDRNCGFSWLKYFAMAPEIEVKMKEEAEKKAKEMTKKEAEEEAEGEEDEILLVPQTLKKAAHISASCIYARGAEHPKLAMLCREYNIPENGDECSFNKCLNYLQCITWPAKNGDHVPWVEVIGEGVAEGYCWVRLPTDDFRALILGRMTGCCQSIGGDSEQCVKDGIELAHHGFYVLLKRRDRAPHNSRPVLNGRLNDESFEIVGQSYAWMSQTGNLTLDSLECSLGRVSNSVATGILSQFAQEVLRTTSVKKVNLGTGGGTPEKLDFEIANISEKMSYGYDYGDAKNQYMIHRQSICRSEFELIVKDLNISSALKDKLHYLCDYWSESRDEIRPKIEHLLQVNPDIETAFDMDALFRLLSMTSRPSLDDLFAVNITDFESPAETERDIQQKKFSVFAFKSTMQNIENGSPDTDSPQPKY